jgi:AraC-like DNA-binding protein
VTVPPFLAPHVTSVVAYDVDLGAPGVHRGLPSTTVTLVLPCEEPLSVSWAAGERVTGWSSLAGLHDRPAQVHHTGRQSGVQLALTPRGSRALLGVPAAALAGQLLSLDDLGVATDLPERLAGTPPARRPDLVVRVLADLLARRGDPGPRAEVARALAQLTRGRTVQAVADDVGWSRRHLATQVRAETGLTPKQVHQLARFERARRLLGHRPLAEVAHTCGFADQSHLTRDWTRYAGCSPTTWLREEFPFVQDHGPTDAAGSEP